MLAQFYSPIIGGEERHVQDLSRELVKRGHTVTIATLDTPGSPEFEIDNGLRIYRLKGTLRRGRWLYSQVERNHAPPLPDPEVTLALRRIIAEEKPEIVHAHNWILYSYLPLKGWSGVPLVLSVHDHSVVCVQKRLMNFGAACDGPNLMKCLRCASNHYGSIKGKATFLSHQIMKPAVQAAVDMFLPVSKATAISNGLIKEELPFEIIPNFVPNDMDSSHDDVAEYTSQLPPDGYLLFVGDLSLDKGVGVLLRAYTELKNPPPLVLIGRKRPDTPEQLPEGVFMMNSWPHTAVMRAWQRSSIGLVPSLCVETFGIVALEAMSMGKPVIASRIGGLTDVVKDGETGYLIAPGDSAALAQTIQRLLDNPSLRDRMGRGALQRSRDFRASVVVPRIEAVYQRLTHNAVDIPGVDHQNYKVLS